ncbi:MAG TPA: GAF domain-containing protein, partial [Polyangiaceae bacterium]
MLLATADGVIVAANSVACRMLDSTEDELCMLQRTDITVMDEAAREIFLRRDREGHSRGRVTLRRRDGSTFPADMSAVAFEALEGPRVHVMLVDVTDAVRARRTLEVLASAGAALGESLDIKETLQRFLSLVVPELADLATVDILDDTEIQRYVVAHRDPSQAELVRTVRRRGFKRSAGVEYVLQTGKPQLVKMVTEEFARSSTHDDEHLAQAQKLGVISFVSVPLIARGRTVGAFTLASTGGVPAYDEHDLTLASALADQAALALDNARTHAAAVRATRLRDQVLEVVSHDLKNPLNTIKLSASSLARRSDAEEISVMRRAVQRAERLIQDLLLASK